MHAEATASSKDRCILQREGERKEREREREADRGHQWGELHGCAEMLAAHLRFFSFKAHCKYPDYADLLMRVRGSFYTHLFK